MICHFIKIQTDDSQIEDLGVDPGFPEKGGHMFKGKSFADFISFLKYPMKMK